MLPVRAAGSDSNRVVIEVDRGRGRETAYALWMRPTCCFCGAGGVEPGTKEPVRAENARKLVGRQH